MHIPGTSANIWYYEIAKGTKINSSFRGPKSYFLVRRFASKFNTTLLNVRKIFPEILVLMHWEKTHYLGSMASIRSVFEGIHLFLGDFLNFWPWNKSETMQVRIESSNIVKNFRKYFSDTEEYRVKFWDETSH